MGKSEKFTDTVKTRKEEKCPVERPIDLDSFLFLFV